MALLWWPNVAPNYFLAFVAGVAYGARAGLFVGFVSMAVTDVLLTALNPVLVVNASAMAAIGLAGALLGRFVDFGQRTDRPRAEAVALAALVGVASVLAFSVLADAASWALFYRNGGAGFLALAAAGLAFNAIPAAVNGLVTAAALSPVLVALRKAGLIARRAALAPA